MIEKIIGVGVSLRYSNKSFLGRKLLKLKASIINMITYPFIHVCVKFEEEDGD